MNQPTPRGRKPVSIPRSAIERLRKDRYTWEAIAAKLNISRATAIRIYQRGANSQPLNTLGDLIS